MPDTSPVPLPPQRHLFDIPDDVAFLNCAYMSPLPKASVAAGEAGLRRKSRPWTIAAKDFFAGSEAVRGLFARLVNAHADDIAIIPAVSYGMAQAASNLQLTRAQTIVTLAEQFPSNVYPWMDLAERTGARFVGVPRPVDDDWTAAVLDVIDSATGVVALTRELAYQWGGRGVRVNALAPSFFPTATTGWLADPDQVAWIAANAPLGRPPRPEELDGPLLFLASDASSYVTGQTLYVDGGWTCR